MSYYPPNTNLRFIQTTPEEERELFRKMVAGDMDAREKIIKNHLLYAAVCARKYAAGRFPEEDVISAANEALMRAVDRRQFDFERGNRFTGYLRPFIRGAISKMWEDQAKRNRIIAQSQTEEHADVAAPSQSADDAFEDIDFRVFVKKVLEKGKEKLNDKERLVLSLMYEQGLNGAQVGRQLKISRERVRQIHSGALVKLKKVFRANGLSNL